MAQAGVLAARIASLPPAKPRLLVAVAGPPASGKSTLAELAAERLDRDGHAATAIPMDGFHLDNAVLEARGLLPRKGAPETFDAAGFVHAMRRLATEDEVILPAFDRERDIAVAGRIAVGLRTRIAVIEGNYLLFDESPWRELADLWDAAIFLDVPAETLRERLNARWLSYGMGDAEARRKTDGNDMPNAERILACRTEARLMLRLP